MNYRGYSVDSITIFSHERARLKKTQTGATTPWPVRACAHRLLKLGVLFNGPISSNNPPNAACQATGDKANGSLRQIETVVPVISVN